MASVLNMKNRFELVDSCLNDSSFIKPTFANRVNELEFYVFFTRAISLIPWPRRR
jgi:hypothetical protein